MHVIRVESYAGSRAEEYPLRFYIHGRRVEIAAIAKSWLTPDGRCFKVTGDDNNSYLLEYNTGKDTWSLAEVSRP